MVNDATVESGGAKQDLRIVDASAQSPITLDSDFGSPAKFERDGNDLLLHGAGGNVLLLEGYFTQSPLPLLQTATGEIVSLSDYLKPDGPIAEPNPELKPPIETKAGPTPPLSEGSNSGPGSDTVLVASAGDREVKGEFSLFLSALEENSPTSNEEANPRIQNAPFEILLFAPDAQDDQVATDEDTPLPDNVLENNGNGADSGSSLTVSAVNGNNSVVGSQVALASGALLTLSADGSFDYDPNDRFDDLAVGESRDDSFTYAISNSLGTDTATVTITIDGVNDPPLPQDDEGLGFGTDEDSAFTTANVLANDEDIDTSDVLTVSGLDTSGTLGQVIDNGDGTFDYDPNGQFESLAAGETATDSFSYEVSDGNGGTETATVTIEITGVNDAPVLVNNSLTLDEGETVVLSAANLSATDPDNHDGDLEFTVSGLSGGQFELAATPGAPVNTFTQQQVTGGEVVFVDDGDEVAPSYSVAVGDGDLATAPAAATVNFTPINDPPVAEDDAVTTDEDNALTFDTRADNGNGADSDAEGGALTVSSVEGEAISLGDTIELSSGADLTLNPDGTFTYDPDGQFESLGGGESAEDSFTYRVSDGEDQSDTIATVTITIEGVDGAAAATSDAGPSLLGAGLALSVTMLPAGGAEIADQGPLTFMV